MDVIAKLTATAAPTRMTFAAYLAARPTAVAIGWAPDVDQYLAPDAMAEVIEASAAVALPVFATVGSPDEPETDDATARPDAQAVLWVMADALVPDNATAADTVWNIAALL